MNPEEAKKKSRGISQDMSPEAISRRLDIASQLFEFALWIEKGLKQKPATPRMQRPDAPEKIDPLNQV